MTFLSFLKKRFEQRFPLWRGRGEKKDSIFFKNKTVYFFKELKNQNLN